jgi:hypothetical protein
MDRPDETKAEAQADVTAGSCCCGDSYASLPAELRAKPAAKNDGLRQVTCPGCGLVYRTNRNTEVCVRCEENRT